MPDLLQDFPPWIAGPIRWSARELFLSHFWDSQEEFDLTMRCRGSEDLVNPKIKAAMVALDRDPKAALMFLREAKKALEEFSTQIIPDEFIREAKDEYLNQEEVDRKWNGKEAA